MITPSPVVVSELKRLVTLHSVGNDTRAFVRSLERSTAALVFREARIDAAGKQQVTVGDADTPDKLATFAPGQEGVMWWLRAVMSPDGIKVGDRAPDTARRLLQRALNELDDRCPRLANELRSNSNRGAGGVAIYRKAPNSPRIITA